MRPSLLLTLLSAATTIPLASAAIKTLIYIDQIPLYTSLQQCAQDRMSAIVRAQELGCGDNMQLTSFACFCIDSSTQFASIISTAVQSACGGGLSRRAVTKTTTREASATTTKNRMVLARRTAGSNAGASGPLPTQRKQGGEVPGLADATSALEAFGSYCARSTELSRFNNNAATTTPPTPTTTSPLPTTQTHRPNSKPHDPRPATPLAAIVVPSILIPVAAFAVIVFYVARRRVRRQKQEESLSIGEEEGAEERGCELDGTSRRVEVGAGEVVWEKEAGVYGREVWEKEGGAVVELDGGEVGVGVGRRGGGGGAGETVRPAGWV